MNTIRKNNLSSQFRSINLMKHMVNNVVSTQILSMNSQFNYHSKFPKSILKNNKKLLKMSNSSKFDEISDSELNKRLDLARENTHTNQRFLLFQSTTN